MTPTLNSISISDFRSIRGTVTIPLNAPIILIHGKNGAGKTSTLSAIELALTGELEAMRRIDAGYKAHLVHRGADLSRIAMSISGIQTSIIAGANDLVIKKTGIEGSPHLIAQERRFFSERSYLAQATLGRLLELYQNATPRDHSPLTKFVNDLLGIDQLDALINGLHSSADIRNFRKLVPEYAEAETAFQNVKITLMESRNARALLLQRKLDAEAVVLSAINSIKPELITGVFNLSENEELIEACFDNEIDEAALIELTGFRREIINLENRLLAFSEISPVDHTTAEAEQYDSDLIVKKWWEEGGQRLETIVEELRGFFPNLPSVISTDPSVAYKTAVDRTSNEIARCLQLIAQETEILGKNDSLLQSAARIEARIALLDEQLNLVLEHAGVLSRVLAEILPHIHNDDCPVCGRDFKEVSAVPLISQVASKVAALNEQNVKLEVLQRARIEALNDLGNVRLETVAATARLLPPGAKTDLISRVEKLKGFADRLEETVTFAETGANFIKRRALAHQRLTALRTHASSANDFRSQIGELCLKLKQRPQKDEESTIDAVGRIAAYVGEEEGRLTKLKQIRGLGKAKLQELGEIHIEVSLLDTKIDENQSEANEFYASLQRAEKKRQSAKQIMQSAVAARTAIVSKVFNKDLNKIWRDLFVRLAPTEPFVPAFRLPESVGDYVAAQLETVHREGGRGGTPGTMLSAGNLNTAALTLFLALHLSVKPLLPWLILDDPVQSMDDVHISQFAALLRTLSKEHGRQIMIAVHDRQLFEYLALELSPAFEGDKLITVELSRSYNGNTIAEPVFHSWVVDNAIAA